jgi:hypothetical protein
VGAVFQQTSKNTNPSDLFIGELQNSRKIRVKITLDDSIGGEAQMSLSPNRKATGWPSGGLLRPFPFIERIT